MRTPFLGPAYVSRSKNLADQRLVNLYLEIVESKSGKDVGGFYMTPGLDLFAACGNGPVRGARILAGVLYVVSGGSIYSVTTAGVVTLVGTIGSSSGPVSMIQNGTQLAIFDGLSGYIVPGGRPLLTAGIVSGGQNYAVNDQIYLQTSGNVAQATPIATVTSVAAGVVNGLKITGGGAYTTPPTTLTQASTSGSGSGLSLGSLVFGPSVPIYVIPLPFTGPVSAAYQDGFGLVSQSGSAIWWQSNLFDLSVWQPLNFTTSDGQADNVVALLDIHLEVFVFKQNNTEVWVNAGLSGFAFQRIAGVLIQAGCAAAFSPCKVGEAIAFLSANEQGQGIVVLMTGYEPKRISTSAIEREIASYPTMADAIGYSYQQEGHTFYVLTFPSGNATWVYDVTASALAGIPIWHQRAAFLNGSFGRHWGNCHVFFANKSLVGDYLTGNLYAYDLATATDNGAQRKWVRSWRALAKPILEPRRFDSLQIDMQTGIGVPDGTNPQLMLRWSDDGGNTWSDQRFQPAGAPGETGQRVKFNRLGSTRRNSGLDRIFELSSTDAFNVCLIGADIDP